MRIGEKRIILNKVIQIYWRHGCGLLKDKSSTFFYVIVIESLFLTPYWWGLAYTNSSSVASFHSSGQLNCAEYVHKEHNII